LAAEALGTALLVAVVVGSGIMGERLAGGNIAVALIYFCQTSGPGGFSVSHSSFIARRDLVQIP
jgi:glycerol uptake facilitator-like aquaporin